jgi:amino acid transporter
LFLRWFGALHPRLHFPHIALLVLGVITAIGTLFNLSLVINMLTAVFVLVQSIAQIVALVVLRRRQPDLPRPYRQWLYPIPTVLALIGWIYVYVSANTGQESLPWIVRPIQLSLVWLIAGIGTFLLWAKVERTWPFGPKEVRERFTAPG